MKAIPGGLNVEKNVEKEGYWKNRTYKRRAVKREIQELGGFIGWVKLARMLEGFKKEKAERDRALFTTAFLTGGRIGEVLLLKTENIEVREDWIIVERMRLFKRYEKTEEWEEWVKRKPGNRLARLYKRDEEKNMFHRTRFYTEKKLMYRSFKFPREEAFVPILLGWLERSKGWLFPGHGGKHLSYIRAYQIISSLGIHPHWIRAQRASCIISYHEMKMEEMMEWMGWENLETARIYARFGMKKLASKMSGRRYPPEALKIIEELSLTRKRRRL